VISNLFSVTEYAVYRTYRIEVSNRFASVKNLNNEVDVMPQSFGVGGWSQNCNSASHHLVPRLREGSSRPGSFGRERGSGHFSHGNAILRDMGHWKELDTRYKHYIYLHELRFYSVHYILDTIHIVN
jgi:hypothetical protein